MSNKPTKEEYLEQQAKHYDSHVVYHATNAFCGTAGKEEMRHIRELTDRLSTEQLRDLITKGGIRFDDSYDKARDRDVYEGVLDEMDREDFYRLYRDITQSKSLSQ